MYAGILGVGINHSELFQGQQIRSKLDALFPSLAQAAQGKQAREATNSQMQENSQLVTKVTYHYSVGTPCYALYYGPRCNQHPRWVPAVVTKVLGTRTINVCVYPRGPTWRRHLSQLRPRHGVEEDADPGEVPHLTGNWLPRDPPVQRKDTAASIVGGRPRYNPHRPTPTENYTLYLSTTHSSQFKVAVQSYKLSQSQCER